MSHQVVALAIAVQTTFLCTLLIALAARKAVGVLLARRLVRNERIVLTTLRGWISGEIDGDQLAAGLSKAHGQAVATVVRRIATVIEGDRWSELVDHLRGSEWFARRRNEARSRFWWRRVASARCLEMLGEPADMPLVNELLRDSNVRVRLTAVSILRRVSDRTALAHVLETALSSNPILQGYLFGCLDYHRREISDLLVDELTRASSADRQCAVLRMMARLEDPTFMDRVVVHALDPQPTVRRACARALASFPHPRSSAALNRLLEDVDDDVRASAAGSLGTLRAGEACDALGRLLNDSSRAVRLQAALALRRVGSDGSKHLRAHLEPSACIDPDLPRYILALDEAAIRGQAEATSW